MQAKALPGASYVWIDRTEVFTPRMLAAYTDQPARNRLLVYGGWQENGVRFDTWEWDGSGWLRRRPLHDPGYRAGATASYDELRQRVLLTGGAADFLPTLVFDGSSTTWEWDGQDWNQLSVVHSPPPLAGAASAWDPVGNRMLMYGGFAPPGTGGVPLEQAPGTDGLWAFDGFDWQQIPRSEPWPPGCGFNSMVWDRARNRLVLLTGFPDLVFRGGAPSFGTTPDGSPRYEPVNDTWEWDGTSWTQTATQQDRGFVSAGGTLFFDPVAQQVGMVVTEADLITRQLKQGLRRYEGVSWPVQSYAPEGTLRILVNAAWSTANGAPFTFGGVKLDPDTFAITTEIALDEGTTGTPWSMQPTPVQMPALSDVAYVTEDDGTSLVFGGRTGTSSTNAMYRWTGGRWTQVQMSGDVPSPRSGAAMSRMGGGALLFGGEGEDDEGMLADTYSWNPTARSWTKLAEGGATPSARQRGVLFEVGGAVTLFGGSAGAAETWRFRPGVGWDQQTLDPNPGARARPCAARLPGNARALLVGDGVDGEVWSFDGSWSQIAETSGIGIRDGCTLVYSSTMGQVLLVGGGGAPGTQDLWVLSPEIEVVTNAINMEPRGERPPRRRGGMFVDNPHTGGATLFGGRRNDTSGELADTWQIKLLGQACSDAAACGRGAFCTDGVCCDVAACGPCASCGAGGICVPGPAGPVPGCDGSYACNDEGHCRLGAGQICQDANACASGACLKADAGGTGVCCGPQGCAVTCVDDRTLRNAEGVLSDCAPYKCEGDRCTLGCASVADCTAGTICNEENKCIEPGSGVGEDSGCGCKVAGAERAGSALGWASLLAFGALAARRRQSGRRRSLAT